MAHLYPHNMVTYNRQELFNHNIAKVTGGKLPQPLFDTIKDNGMCAVTRGWRAGRNRQRTVPPTIGRRPGFVPTDHQPGVNNVNIIRLKLTNCQTQTGLQTVANDCEKCSPNVAMINARSVRNKTLTINEDIIEHEWDVLAITETWLKKTGDEVIVAELTPPGYTFQHVARASGRGGGVATVHRNTFNTKILPKMPFTTIELLRLLFIKPHLVTYNARVAYHPPSSRKTHGTTSNFYAELEQLFIEASISVIPNVIVCDVNVHFDDHIKSEPIRTLLESFNLTQYVSSIRSLLIKQYGSPCAKNRAQHTRAPPSGCRITSWRIEITLSVDGCVTLSLCRLQ